jgi:hypothetical protein
LIGMEAAGAVFEVQDFGAVGDIGAAVAGDDAGWEEKIIGKDCRLVGAAGAGRVLQHHHLILRLLPRLDLRIRDRRSDPETPVGIKVHLNRLADHWIGRKEIDLKPISDFQRLPLDFGIGFVRGIGCARDAE